MHNYRNQKLDLLCPTCGRALVMRYPHGDPENGPADLRCPDNCHAGEPCGLCYDRWHEDQRPTPDRTETHDSWGHGLPEVDAENERLIAMYEAAPVRR